MMSNDELLSRKVALIRAAEMAQIIGGLEGDEIIEMDESEYEQSIEALIDLKENVNAIVNELEVLRVMFAHKCMDTFFSEDRDGTQEGKGREPGYVGDSKSPRRKQSNTRKSTSGGVRKKKTKPSGGEVRDEQTPTDERPRRSRSTRKQSDRPDARPDKEGGGSDS